VQELESPAVIDRRYSYGIAFQPMFRKIMGNIPPSLFADTSFIRALGAIRG
jgi:hypothetical protein